MMIKKHLHTPLLIMLFGAVVLALGRSLLAPVKNDDQNIAAFALPTQVPLPGWQLKTSKSLNEQPIESQKYIMGQQYHYSRNNLDPEAEIFEINNLEIEMRYVVATDGDIRKLTRQFTSIPSVTVNSGTLNQQPESGAYILFADQNTAYLGACINARGKTTVTEEQFQKNRLTQDIQPNRFLLWFLGYAPLRDNRCLWAHLSTPLTQTSLENTYQSLENIWLMWYRWWQPRFPTS